MLSKAKAKKSVKKEILIHGAAVQAKEAKSGRSLKARVMTSIDRADDIDKEFICETTVEAWRAKSTINLDKSIVSGTVATLELSQTKKDKRGVPLVEVKLNQVLNTAGMKESLVGRMASICASLWSLRGICLLFASMLRRCVIVSSRLEGQPFDSCQRFS